MNVFTVSEGINQPLVSREVGQNPQLNLGIITGDKVSPGSRHYNRTPDLTA